MSPGRWRFCLKAAGLLLAAGLALWGLRQFPVERWLDAIQRDLAGMAWGGAALYPAVFAACNILLLPGGVLAIGSGLFYGLWWGFLLNLLGSVAGAAVAFGIARTVGRRWVENRLLLSPKWKALDAALAREGGKIVFLSQVHPLFPSSLLNYLYGVTRIPFGTCMLWIALGQAPGLFLYAYLGTFTRWGVDVWRGNTSLLPGESAGAIAGLLFTVLVTWALGRRALRLLADLPREPVPGPGAAFPGPTPGSSAH